MGEIEMVLLSFMIP